MSAMPIALAEQYRNLYPFLENTSTLLSKLLFQDLVKKLTF